MEVAAAKLRDKGLTTRTAEKWESDSELLRLRGFDAAESSEPKLICRNAYPIGDVPIDFFMCEYAPKLRRLLAPTSFPNVAPVAKVVVGTPHPADHWHVLSGLFGLPIHNRGVEIELSEEPTEFPEVIQIVSDRGPIDLKGWPSRFTFV